MGNQRQTNPNGSLRLTPDICSGRSGTMLLACLKQLAPDHVRLVGIELVENITDAKLVLYIYWRQKLAEPRRDTRINSDHSLRFEVDYWNPELPAEVIIAKFALI